MKKNLFNLQKKILYTLIIQLHLLTLLVNFTNLQKQKGFHFLDAPISGGQAGAEGGTLTVMVGGEETPFKKAEPIIDCYSKKIKIN